MSSIKILKIAGPCFGEWGAMKNPHNDMKIIGRSIPIKIFNGNEYFVKPIVMIRIVVVISIRNLIGALSVNKFI
ncbi:hypothetical protein FD33_GL001798 [Companilactobacillus paralimentarius DSM 13238 = JCM 10415]|jgi:hypothetical protein|uniref:Uncharacterized protein n=1 Tax=Companilactobacillus paralimentarius DSM 13238 = JCM 10415 TaxID=1122151 RepID=A0A0R1PGR6_9LACO|nr:hypothetical protein ATN96_09080 [Companilactobacillus paralimentarius]KRL31655.1 hypothetical protein FD33_GL001798 [Companilactobacillus paralimentarius DSM 13238 = JCM 10415]